MDRDQLEELLDHASNGRYMDVQSLVNEGVDLDGTNSEGDTALMLAAVGSHRDVVELLINSGADIHCCNVNGWTLLHYASFTGSVEIVQCLVNEGVALDMKYSNGETSLMLAARWSRREVVELLINSGADIHCCDDAGWTVLHHASFSGSEEIVQYLLNKGLAINVKGSDGKTPLMFATDGVAEWLIMLGADIHCCDNNGWTVLHHASCRGSGVIVQCLLSKGVALDVKEANGVTPLMMAALFSNTEVVKMLINSGADIHCCDDSGRTALHYSSIEIKASDEVTPLIKAAIRSHREVVELLYSSGADINCCEQCNRVKTELYTSRRGDIANYLLKVGADCNLEDKAGETPFSLLIRNKSPSETIKLCIEKGGYVKSRDYSKMLEDPFLKRFVLQDVKLCTQAIINKFNNKDLCLFYEGHLSVQKLPRIDKMKIGDGSGMVREIERAVAHEIQEKGFCNLFEMAPLVLGMLCVKPSIEESKSAFNQANPTE